MPVQTKKIVFTWTDGMWVSKFLTAEGFFITHTDLKMIQRETKVGFRRYQHKVRLAQAGIVEES